MALIIDFTGKQPTKDVRPTPDQPLAKDGKAPYEQCTHRRCVISEEQRTVMCKDCGAAVDPLAYILLLYHQYETRIDRRLDDIRAYEKRKREREARATTRKQQPRRARIARRGETAERAAFNEYQSKVLAARAERQRALVARLDEEISNEEAKAAAVDSVLGGVS